MIRYLTGDIFQSEMQTLVVPVNTVGVMGAGLAKEFARRYPKMFEIYREDCEDGIYKVGRLGIWRENISRWILNFPTKTDWRKPSKLEYIEAGLETLVETYERAYIESIAFPKLGCGLGGLHWPDVRALFEDYLNQVCIDVEVLI